MNKHVSTWVEPTVIVVSSYINDRCSWIRRGTRIAHSRISGGIFIGFQCQLLYAELYEASMLGAKCRLLGTEANPISVGAYSWLGAGVTVDPGVRIGEGAVVGAGSHVTADVPDYTIAAGKPAKLLRKREVIKDGIPEFADFLAFIRHQPVTTPAYNEDAQIGEGNFITATVQSGDRLRVGHQCMLIGRTNAEGNGGIHAGAHVEIGDRVILEALGGIHIGDHVHIGDDVLMVTTTHDYGLLSLPQLRQPIVIASNARIGNESIIIGGVTIGEGATVLPGSLVIKNVGPYETVSGVPAKAAVLEASPIQ
ncbi:DapH/DapD/GlmU-related protein [Paenibacillus sp. SI8]|uniref:acyltransferase n=1 Tax=unclassified Paenibacillus TaxID=185978 RepID=UPI00346639AE